MPNLALWPLLEQLTIKTKSAQMKRLRRDDKFAWAQRAFVEEVERQYNAGKPVRIIVLKGRQLGLSTVTEAILFLWCFLHQGTQAMVLNKEKGDSEYLFSMTKRYWELGPFADLFTTKYNRQGYLEWNETGSSITVDTAKKEEVGRGRTLQAVHGSEPAFWPGEDDIVGGLMEAIPYEHGTICVLESTANGVGGFFHDEWVKATDPSGEKSTFTPMFFPWWEHDEYAVPDTPLRYSDLDDDERDLFEIYQARGLTIPKLAWRRRKLTTYSDPTRFQAEYPMSPDEAFLSTGVNVFDLVKLQKCYQQLPSEHVRQGFTFAPADRPGSIEFVDDPGGHLWLYREPDPRGRRRYVVAVDPTWTTEGDPACIQVIDRISMEQVAVWHGQTDPETIAQISLSIAKFYGPSTILNSEVQGGGRVVIQTWRDADWPHIWLDRRPDRMKRVTQTYGFLSSYPMKQWLIGVMQSVIAREGIIIHHPGTFYELCRYVSLDDGTYGPARRSGHDDTVISLGIAILTCVTEAATLDWAALAASAPAHRAGERLRFTGQGEPVQIRGYNDRPPPWAADQAVGVDEFY